MCKYFGDIDQRRYRLVIQICDLDDFKTATYSKSKKIMKMDNAEVCCLLNEKVYDTLLR